MAKALVLWSSADVLGVQAPVLLPSARVLLLHARALLIKARRLLVEAIRLQMMACLLKCGIIQKAKKTFHPQTVALNETTLAVVDAVKADLAVNTFSSPSFRDHQISARCSRGRHIGRPGLMSKAS